MTPEDFFGKHPSLKEVERGVLKYCVMDYGSGYFKCEPHLFPDAVLIEGVEKTQTDNAVIKAEIEKIRGSCSFEAKHSLRRLEKALFPDGAE